MPGLEPAVFAAESPLPMPSIALESIEFGHLWNAEVGTRAVADCQWIQRVQLLPSIFSDARPRVFFRPAALALVRHNARHRRSARVRRPPHHHQHTRTHRRIITSLMMSDGNPMTLSSFFDNLVPALPVCRGL